MRKITLLLILASISLQAQKIKIKKGEIFLDENKVGIIEKEKVKGANNFLKVLNNDKKHLFSAKLVSEESVFFGALKRSNYFIIECIEQKDSIGIENLGFYLGEKQVAKYLVKNGILTSNGFNLSKADDILLKTESKPSFAIKKVEQDLKFIENITYIVNRDKSNPLFVEEITTSAVYSIIDKKSVNQTKYKLLQGKDESNKTLIGYAYLEVPEIGRSKLIIVNVKDTPIAVFDNFKHYTFYPLTELSVELSELKRLDKPVESIYQFTQMLIDENKL